MTLFDGPLDRAADHARELASATGKRHAVRLHRSQSRRQHHQVWRISESGLDNVPKKARV